MLRSLMKYMKGLQIDNEINVEGILNRDTEVISPCQEECAQRITRTIRLEHESYLNEHPEVGAMLNLFVMRAAQQLNRKDIYANIARYFTRPITVIDEEIREYLNLPRDEPYLDESKKRAYEDENLYYDLNNIILTHYPREFDEPPPSETGTYFTTSSSFLSANTSSITLPTPEPVRTPVPTTSEIFYKLVSDTLNKATFSHVTEEMLKYDTAYVELMKAVEQAMEITVIEIKEDIAELFNNAYYQFEIIIKEREKIAGEIAWEKRMRKKLKRTLRRQNNFKGYETPPTPKSELSSHESYKIAPPRPCACHPHGTFNRYPKDRFGIYLPRDVQLSNANITLTPNFSTHSIHKEAEEKTATK